LVAGLLACGAARASDMAAQAATYPYMQIVAHPDDDLLFINPDLQTVLGQEYASVTVVTTAAEAAGGHTTADSSRAVFAGLRQQGLRAAYAAMTGVSNAWTRTTQYVAGHDVELDYLTNAPRVKLVFLNLYDGGDPLYPISLTTLNGDPAALRWSFVPQGGIVALPYAYSHATLLQTLVALIAAYQPGTINTLDPDPQLICGPVEPGHSCLEYLDDNPDHVATAQFANEALLTYDGPNHTHRFATMYHRGYAMSQYRGNLGANDYARKRGICDVYKAYDSNFQFYENDYLGLFGATFERYWGSTRWLQPMSDGRLAAFAVQDRQVVAWTENSVGGTWTGPTRLGGRPVAPHVEVARYADGRLRLFALGVAAGSGHHVLTAVQATPNGPFGAWLDIGCPDAFDWPDYQQWTGLPAAAIDAAGHAEVFARNAAGSVGWCAETASGWTTWTALSVAPGEDLQDGLAAIRASDGYIDVFGAYRSGTGAHWRQQASGAYTLDSAFPVYNLASPPTVTKNSDGRLEIFYREAGSAGPAPGDVYTAFVNGSGVWSTNLVDLGGPGGIGPVAAMLRTTSGQIMLFARNDYNGVNASWQGTPNASFNGIWQDIGGVTPSFPAAAVDGTGRVVAAAIGTDGMLWIQREVALGSTGSFNGWNPVGADPASAGVEDGARTGTGIAMGAFPSVMTSTTELRFAAPLASNAELVIHDVAGRVLARLDVAAGASRARWDGRDAAGRPVAAGLYFIRIVSAAGAASSRVVVAR
jgi:LmbE family N-acetylglucosaminyl deacetylase